MRRNDRLQLISLTHPSGLALDLMNRGATWLSCRVPMGGNSSREVILGCLKPCDYELQGAYLGAMIGRYTNRIADAVFARNQRTYHLTRTDGTRHQLHGGPDGFHRRYWSVISQSAISVRFRLESPDGDQGYPGDLIVFVQVILSGPRQITLDITAETTEDCPVCLTHHPYFNLDAVHDDARHHSLEIAAEQFLPIDSTLIPTGSLAAVDSPAHGGAFDFRQSRTISSRWLPELQPQQQLADGYDHAYLLLEDARIGCRPAAVLRSSDKRLSMQITTSMPALQLYTGQHLAGIIGRDGLPLRACAGIALEPEFLPDSPNHPEWPQPTCWLASDETYRHTIRYDFNVL